MLLGALFDVTNPMKVHIRIGLEKKGISGATQRNPTEPLPLRL
jgi:hypothetical protein